MNGLPAHVVFLFGVGPMLIGQEHPKLKRPTVSVWEGQADQNSGTFTLVLEARDGIANEPSSWRHIRGIIVAQDHRRKCVFELGDGEILGDDRLSAQCQSGRGGRLRLTFKDKANDANRSTGDRRQANRTGSREAGTH